MVTYGRHTTTGVKEQIHPNVTVGNFTLIGHDTTFWGTVNYPSINHPEAVANCSFNNHLGTQGYYDMGDKGPIQIGNDVWIGDGCDILSGVTIGNGAIIGLKTVVSKDVPAYAVVVGHPMVIKKYRFAPSVIERLEKIAWWEWSDREIIERVKDFLDVKHFIEKYG